MPVLMSTSVALGLACLIIQDNPEKAAPLLRLLHAFKDAHGDPAGEVMMRKVIRGVYAEMDECDDAISRFIKDAGKSSSVAA